jgi:hypothetical protein
VAARIGTLLGFAVWAFTSDVSGFHGMSPFVVDVRRPDVARIPELSGT